LRNYLREIRRWDARVTPFSADRAFKRVTLYPRPWMWFHCNRFGIFIHWFTTRPFSTGEHFRRWGAMAGKTQEEGQDAQTLSEAMRAIRKERRLRASEMARLLDMPLRSYEHFEGGRGKISFDRIVRFAEATNSDPIALLAVLPLGKPEFALHCADNKLMTIFMHAMGELEEQLGADIGYLNSGTLVGAFTRLVKDLVENVRKRDTFAEQWLEQHGARSQDSRRVKGWRRKPGD